MATKNHGGKREGAGLKRRLKAADVATVGSIRLTAAQWKLFYTWGGVARLRKHLNTVKGGIAKNA